MNGLSTPGVWSRGWVNGWPLGGQRKGMVQLLLGNGTAVKIMVLMMRVPEYFQVVIMQKDSQTKLFTKMFLPIPTLVTIERTSKILFKENCVDETE